MGYFSCDDGRILSAALRGAIPNILIISNSGSKDPGFGDIEASKLDIGAPGQILAAIKSIPEPQL